MPFGLFGKAKARGRAPGRPDRAARQAALFDEAFMAKLEYLDIVAKKAYAGQTRGERRSKKLGAGLEFADHRSYAPGDDFRNIDWNVYARLGKLLLRQYEEEEDLYVYLLVDASASMAAPDQAKLDQARRLAAALAYVTLSSMERVSVVAFSEALGTRTAPARGKAQIFRLFELLAGLEPGGQTRMEDAFKAFVHATRRRGLAIVLSDFYAPDGYEAGLNLLRHHRFEPFVLHLTDERELDPKLRGDLVLVDCETGAEREVTVTPRVLERYRQAFEGWCGELETFCKARQVPYFRTSAQQPFEELVLRMFRAGGLLR